MWGEGWHNKHHWKPQEPTFKYKWWEFDIGHQFIKLLSKKEK